MKALAGMKRQAGVEIIAQGDTAVVALKTPCLTDVKLISGAAEEIRAFIADNHPKKVVFDFGHVRFFSSQVLGLLLDVQNKLGAFGAEVVISGINPQLHRVFRITNLDQIFRFFPDTKSALRDM